jgi:hypothetical protein
VCRDCGDEWDEQHEDDRKEHGVEAPCYVERARQYVRDNRARQYVRDNL